nr:MAG TPA: hypothetical protein [Caudoviricetes sp.]
MILPLLPLLFANIFFSLHELNPLIIMFLKVTNLIHAIIFPKILILHIKKNLNPLFV